MEKICRKRVSKGMVKRSMFDVVIQERKWG